MLLNDLSVAINLESSGDEVRTPPPCRTISGCAHRPHAHFRHGRVACGQSLLDLADVA